VGAGANYEESVDVELSVMTGKDVVFWISKLLEQIPSKTTIPF